MEGVLPFDMEKLLPFQMGYLSGFQAERRDMDGESFADEAEQEVKQYTLDRLRSSMDTYSSCLLYTSELLYSLMEAGLPVSGFIREQGDLESIFMQITSHDKGKVVLSSEE